MIRLRFGRHLCLLLSMQALGQAAKEDPHLDRALDLMHQQRFDAAVPELEQARQMHPSTPAIENLLGIANTQIGDLSAADGHYLRAIDLDAKLPGPHKNLGFNMVREKQYTAAERELKIALALDANDPFVHYYLACLYLASGRDTLAVDQLEPSRALLKNDPENELLMAKACLKLRHIPEALALIHTLADDAELTPLQNYDLAVLLTGTQLYPEAVLRFEAVLKAQPESWVAQYDLAVADLNAGHPDAALAILRPLASAQPANASVQSTIGSAYESANQLPQALEAYGKAVRADPQNADRYLDYTRLLMDLDRNDEAMKVVEQGIKDMQDAYALDVRLGVLRIRQARYEEARSALGDALHLHPELVVGYVAVAQSYMQQGNDEQALDSLLKARGALPQDATLEFYVGLVSLRLGHLAEAEIALTNSGRLRPEAIETHSQLGKLYLQTDRIAQAQTEFERVIALAPDNSNAHYQLSKIYARAGDKERSREMASETRRLMQAERDDALRLQQHRLSSFQLPVAAAAN